MEVSFSTPLPPPEILAGYNDAIPGLGREVVEMLKAESEHRREGDREERARLKFQQERELDLIERDLKEGWVVQRRGQWLAFAIALVGVCGGGMIAFLGSPAAGGSIGVAAIGTLAVAYLKRTSTGASEKRSEIPQAIEDKQKPTGFQIEREE
jgi:uncharacterized membrane protein